MSVQEAAHDFGKSLLHTEDISIAISDDSTGGADTMRGNAMDPSESLENQTGDRHSTEEALKGGSKVAEASSQDAPADKNDKPTITADHEAFKWDYYTCYGTWGQTYTNLISFLQKPNLPLIWQAQVHCNIGTMRVYSDEPQIPDFVREACLAKAERLLEEARRVYVHDPKDAATLMRLALRIE